jgi:hypothetical protein
VSPEHFRESLVYGLFFAGVTVAQGLVAVVVVRGPDRRVLRWVALGSASVVVLWLVSRTTGVPVGREPWRAESFGGLDVLASLAELVTVVGCVLHLRVPRHR